MPVAASLSIRTLFAPWDNTTEEFLAWVRDAKQSLDVSIYGFHLPALTQALIEKHQAGVRVSIILDHSQAAGKAEQEEVQKLLNAGVPLLIGESPVHGQILHAKFTVKDAASVQHGSWNYSLSASQQLNDMHFVDDPDFAHYYQAIHEKIRTFILLHEMTLQPKGEVIPAPALPSSDGSDPALAAAEQTLGHMQATAPAAPAAQAAAAASLAPASSARTQETTQASRRIRSRRARAALPVPQQGAAA